MYVHMLQTKLVLHMEMRPHLQHSQYYLRCYNSCSNSITASSASSGGNVEMPAMEQLLQEAYAGQHQLVRQSPEAIQLTDRNRYFHKSIIGASGNTTYYLRAYATNSAETSYGSEITFTTYAATDADGNNYTSVTSAPRYGLQRI